MQAVVQSAKNTGRLKQCSMGQNFPAGVSLEDRCRITAELGMWGMDLVGAQDWPTLRKYGLQPTAATGGGMGFPNGIIRTELHNDLEKSVGALIDQCAEGGCPNIIGIGGTRRGMSYEQGADNAVAFFNRIKSHLEDKNITMVTEVVNTRNDVAFFNRVKSHLEDKNVMLVTEVVNTRNDDPALGRTDQIFNHMAWAADVMKRVNSPRVKILCDVYHMQIMDGDIARNIRDYYPWIGHFHTGGVPGRRELDDTQEINYRYVAQVIADLGYAGFVSHEYHPTEGRDFVASLKQAVDIMRV
jgi:hydroxypyruvate isomerase